MKRGAPLPVVFFRSRGGSEPVRTWLRGLPREERRMIGTDLARLQWGWPAGRPLAAPLGRGLFELRSDLASGRTARVIFGVSDTRIIALHGFIKKSRRIPAQELALARARMREWEQAGG